MRRPLSMSIKRAIYFSEALLFAATCACMFTGCNNNPNPNSASTDQAQPGAPDQSTTDQSQSSQPAQSNGSPQQAETSGNLVQASAGNNEGYQNYSDDNYDADDQDSSYGQPVLQAEQPPPPLPQYSQPECPGDGYLWTPGDWSYAPQGYYWVPGAWAQPPQSGYLWTPGYWGLSGGRYRYHYGFWGQHIGYYGGINYGFGYTGVGYQGGYWNHGAFSYNRSVNNVSNVHVTNVYNSNVTVVQNTHVSFNGGKG